MKITIFETDPFTLFIAYAIIGLLSLIIPYYLMKAAVKNGMIAAQKEINTSRVTSEPEKSNE